MTIFAFFHYIGVNVLRLLFTIPGCVVRFRLGYDNTKTDNRMNLLFGCSTVGLQNSVLGLVGIYWVILLTELCFGCCSGNEMFESYFIS